MLAIIGLILGILLGLILNIPIPQAYTMYIAVFLISSLTSLSAVIADRLENVYQNTYALYSFLGNMLVSLALALLGQQLNIPLEYVVYFGLGSQLYRHLHRIWRQLAAIHLEKINKK